LAPEVFCRRCQRLKKKLPHHHHRAIRLTNLGFLLGENFLLCSSYLPLGVANWTVIYINTVPHQANFLSPLLGIEEEEAPTSTTFSHVNYAPTANFLAPLPGRKNTSARGVSHAHPLLCLLFCFTLFLLALFKKNRKKISFLYSCYFITFSSLCCSLSMFWRTFQ
jgi:hypothetical protein